MVGSKRNWTALSAETRPGGTDELGQGNNLALEDGGSLRHIGFGFGFFFGSLVDGGGGGSGDELANNNSGDLGINIGGASRNNGDDDAYNDNNNNIGTQQHGC